MQNRTTKDQICDVMIDVEREKLFEIYEKTDFVSSIEKHMVNQHLDPKEWELSSRMERPGCIVVEMDNKEKNEHYTVTLKPRTLIFE